ncbi:MAG: response regulator [Elusimicrobiales bacterium]|nr:response regulator [Elusimicrobiales bacterium]
MTSKANILIVDDEAQIAEMILATLQANGYSAAVAFNGSEGLKKAAAEKFDLAIMDIQMPEMDGITALGEIKKIDPEIEVIIATGHGTMGTAIQSMRKGAFDYLHKPFELKELLKVVERAVEKRKFNDIAKVIFSTIKPEDQLRVIIDAVTRIMKADESMLVLPDAEGKPRVAVSNGLEDEESRASRLEMCARVTSQPEGPPKALLLVENPSIDNKFAGIKGLEKVKFSLFLPLVEDNKPAGLININRDEEDAYFTEDDMQRARIFASLVNLAMRNSSLYRQLQETQSQLIQAEKMSALGQLAGGLAHEINNPLSGILGLTQLVLESLPKDGQNYADLKEIEKAVFRCKKIIVSLLSFSRQEKTRMEPVNINEAIEETLTLCARQMELKHVKINRQLTPGLPMVNADFQQLMQVFLNLFTNARDAMPDGGELSIETRLLRTPAGVELLMTSITDTGAGISRDILDKIFDPFFTTKPVGKGTGLGLSVCLGIIHKHNGAIKAQSEPGRGSTFTISLPV